MFEPVNFYFHDIESFTTLLLLGNLLVQHVRSTVNGCHQTIANSPNALEIESGFVIRSNEPSTAARKTSKRFVLRVDPLTHLV